MVECAAFTGMLGEIVVKRAVDDVRAGNRLPGRRVCAPDVQRRAVARRLIVKGFGTAGPVVREGAVDDADGEAVHEYPGALV